MRAALGASRAALRRMLLAESLVLCGAGALARRAARAAARGPRQPLRRALLGARARRRRGPEPALGRQRPRARRGGGARLRAAAAVVARDGRAATGGRRPADHAGHGPPPARLRRRPDRALVRAAVRRGHAARRARGAADGQDRLRHAPGAGGRRAAADRGLRPERRSTSTRRRRAGSRRCPGVAARGDRPTSSRGATRGCMGPGFRFTVEGYDKVAGEEDPHGAAADRHAGLLRRARRAARRRARLHRGRPRATASAS